MKGYEDVAAGLMLLVVVLIGGYYYLQSEAYHQKQSLHQIEKRVELKVDKRNMSKFEAVVKVTE